jgi:hypothetical protein
LGSNVPCTLLKLYLNVLDSGKAASHICQGKAGLQAGQSGGELRDKRRECCMPQSSDSVCVLANQMGRHPQPSNGDEDLN